MSALTQADFSYVQELVHEAAAIVIEEGKDYLVESRLGPLARSEGLHSVEELLRRARGLQYGPLHHRIVEAMTTNETSWFRDVHPYDALRSTVVPALLGRRAAQRSLTIWSAACSTGQEPYSVGMILLDDFPELASWNVTVLASDLSDEAVARARTGRYSQLEVNRGLPAPALLRHFERDGAQWVVNDRLRSMVRFGVINLAKPWPEIPQVDVVMLRNVMIYFDLDTKRRLLERMRGVLRPDGYLFLGNAETTMGIDESFVRIEPTRASCYQMSTAVPTTSPVTAAWPSHPEGTRT